MRHRPVAISLLVPALTTPLFVPARGNGTQPTMTLTPTSMLEPSSTDFSEAGRHYMTVSAKALNHVNRS